MRKQGRLNPGPPAYLVQTWSKEHDEARGEKAHVPTDRQGRECARLCGDKMRWRTLEAGDGAGQGAADVNGLCEWKGQ